MHRTAAPGRAAAADAGGQVLDVLAEAQVLTVLAGEGQLTGDHIAARVDDGYQPLVPAALERLAAQGAAEQAGRHWRIAS